MTIRALLNSGRSDETALEKAADIMLAFPRLMWHGRSVRVEMQPNGCAQVNEDSKGRWKGITNMFGKLFSGDGSASFGSGLVLAIIGPLFLAANVLAAPLFGVGLILKKIAISQDPAAAKVSAKVEQFLRNEELIKKEGQLRKECTRLIGSIEYATKQMERFPSQNWQEFKKSHEDELMQVEKEIEEIHSEVGAAIVPHLIKVKSTLETAKQKIEKKIEDLKARMATLQEEDQKQRVNKAFLKLECERLQLEGEIINEKITSLDKKIELLVHDD